MFHYLKTLFFDVSQNNGEVIHIDVHTYKIDVKLFNDSNHEKYALVQTPTVYPEKYTKSR